MTINEAAEKLGLEATTLRWQIRNGRLRAVKHGRDCWISPVEVERYRREHLGKPGRPAKEDV